jgi:hypothetical protein
MAGATIAPDTPLRLKDAVAIAFPAGGMTVSGLRREVAKGRLVLETIARKQFVTLRAIDEMRLKCRENPKAPACTFAGDAAANPHGLSSTEQTKSALVAAQTIAERLKKPSPPTSPKSTSHYGTTVIPLR